MCVMSSYFALRNEVFRHYRLFSAERIELTKRMSNSPLASAKTRSPSRHFADSVEEPFEYSLQDFDLGDMVGI